jgi:hypothetical protein
MTLYGAVIGILLLFPWLLVGAEFAGAWVERVLGRHRANKKARSIPLNAPSREGLRQT